MALVCCQSVCDFVYLVQGHFLTFLNLGPSSVCMSFCSFVARWWSDPLMAFIYIRVYVIFLLVVDLFSDPFVAVICVQLVCDFFWLPVHLLTDGFSSLDCMYHFAL